jgi:hypothetical protein
MREQIQLYAHRQLSVAAAAAAAAAGGDLGAGGGGGGGTEALVCRALKMLSVDVLRTERRVADLAAEVHAHISDGWAMTTLVMAGR